MTRSCDPQPGAAGAEGSAVNWLQGGLEPGVALAAQVRQVMIEHQAVGDAP
ncbi:MAG TPA: hypothetical protein VLM11_23030 [Streptosporangiaceae bacterium]|nr:hypothetical protein [Streptosporangiaceae bacterium]